ncbi:type VII secretion protein EccB [Nocardia sp. NRRL S-836]|uniref:type VII secretion protein EccB n=1 Tax=Nocardia sp. NRRL S-836 TaxID=1519492 RepID=UPI0006AFB8C5|nr:type VII secretion protein EccB [Nocardia sp. NRRL S-836]KOV87228.1 type VII secretion protein [Nocardia sp. NRRL S-836]
MASKHDQLQAYQFSAQRVTSALVTRETDPEQPPFRRPGNAVFGSIAIAVIALAGAGIYGIINPGGNKGWQDGKSVIVEKETGTRYVYLDQRLHPVMNYASALLAMDEHAPTLSVSRDSLTGVPRGPRIGIPDAPDALPDKDGLLTGGWTLCSQPTADEAGAVKPTSALMVGQQAPGGAELGDRAVLADVPETGARYLVHRGYRHLVDKADVPAVGVALGATPAIQVAPAVVEAIPQGAPVAPIPVADIGKPAGIGSFLAGQLLAVRTSGGVQHYLAEKGRLRPITELQYDIQRAHQATAAAYPGAEPKALPIGLIEAGNAPQTPVVPPKAGDPPTVRPEFAPGGDAATLCLTFGAGTGVPTVTLDPPMPKADPLTSTPKRTDRGAVLADRVLVPAGQAALVEAVATPDAPRGTVIVVTDQGIAYPLADPKVVEVLGFAGVQPVRMPAGLVARIPSGSGLGHDAALRR